MRLLLISSIISFVLLAACGGIKFANYDVNMNVPEIVSGRLIYSHSLGYNMNRLAGGIFQRNEDGHLVQIGTLLPDSMDQPGFQAIEDPAFTYRSLIHIKENSEIGGLGFLVNYVSDGLSEVELYDDCIASIYSDNSINHPDIVELAVAWVNDNERESLTNGERIWIHSVVVMKCIVSRYMEISSNASGVFGQVVGIDAGVFKRLEQQSTRVIVAYEASNIDALASGLKLISAFPDSVRDYTEIIEAARMSGVMEEEILYSSDDN